MLLQPQSELLASQRKPTKTGEEGIIVALQRLWHPLILDLHIQKIRLEVPAFSLNQTGKGTAQHYSGIGQFVNYQTCTGLRQHGCQLLLVTEPETVDPGIDRCCARIRIPLTVKSRTLIQYHSIKDAISITTIRVQWESTNSYNPSNRPFNIFRNCSRRICSGPKLSLNY